MNGTMVTFPVNGRTADGYLSLPPVGKGPGLIVLQEYWGLVDHIKSVADRFAAEGFVALAPDIYHGERTTSPDDAGKLLMALNIAEAGKDIRGAAMYLRTHPAVQPKKVAAIGFCMGGMLALYAGQEHSDVISAVVDFYGVHPEVTIDPARLRVPVLGHVGKQDKSGPTASMLALADAVRKVGGSFEVHEYDAGHAFFNDARVQVYNAGAAKLAWERTLEFLKKRIS
ncbi:MAG TPA: dienelactone hydrolase family protein [Gemmatimonadaceae bacterium]|nr:dienelactone hydrolase family protein [Gemmatimonadaceae bacterium]